MQDLLSQIICNHKLGNISYTLDDCPRCNSEGKYFDIHVGNHGDFDMVLGSSRLLADVYKALSEQLGTNIEDNMWGSNLYQSLLVRNPDLTKAHIVSSVIGALKELKILLEEENLNYGLPESEMIAPKGVGDLKLLEDPAEPRRLILQITIIAQSREDVQVQVPLEI